MGPAGKKITAGENSRQIEDSRYRAGRRRKRDLLSDLIEEALPREFVAVVEQAHQNGDDGWAVGSFSLTISVPGNEAVQEKGLWVDVYERQSNQWFARVDSYNNGRPSASVSRADLGAAPANHICMVVGTRKPRER